MKNWTTTKQQAVGKRTVVIEADIYTVKNEILPWIAETGLKKLNYFHVDDDQHWGFKFANDSDKALFKLRWG